MNATAVATAQVGDDGSWVRSTPGTPSAFMLASIGSALELPWVGRDKTPKQIVREVNDAVRFTRQMALDERIEARLA